MRRPFRALSPLAPSALIAALLVACSPSAPSGPRRTETPGRKLAPTRGYVLISIDTLRADHVGAYGYQRPTTPFLDSLAARGVLFERAYTPIPATLPAHLSMFTGLYPGEHGVYPPSGVLSPEIPTLPEAFRAAGFRTAGHSEGGFVMGGYGFARGFDEWTDSEYTSDADVDRTFGRGAEFLSRVRPGERFFLFLHTYSVHDPYAPPGGAGEFWSGPPPAGAFDPTGENLASFNRGRLAADKRAGAYYRALYDASIRYVDGALERLYAELERLGLADETTIVVTSDHGEEFLEHGRLAHTQVYPECLHVPLVVVPPGDGPAVRVPALVQLVDLPATLAALAGIAPPAASRGRDLAPLVADPAGSLDRAAYAEDEMLGGRERTLLADRDGGFFQVLHSVAEQEADGYWVSREIRFDAVADALDFRAVAFHAPREVEVEVDGEPTDRLALATDWRPFRLALPGSGKRAVRLSTPDCTTPVSLGLSSDARCLSFKLQGLALERLELYDLGADPGARRDLSGDGGRRLRELLAALDAIHHAPVAQAGSAALSEEQERQLKALGYL